MDTAPAPALPSARAFPDGVPVLLGSAPGRPDGPDPVPVRLRAGSQADFDGMVEQSRDAQAVTWTTVPVPEGGYGVEHAAAFFEVIRSGWQSGRRLTWTIETDLGQGLVYAGGIDLRVEEEGAAEVGFALHPRARGRSVMSTALRLACGYGFDVVGLELIRWRALVGNWPSRRVAAACGFRLDGTVRRLLRQRDTWRDGWVATLLREDPRTARPWLDQPVLAGGAVVVRGFTDADTDRIVEACSDPRTRHWLASLPNPYGLADARSFLTATRELAAAGAGLAWCIADPVDDRCLGSITLAGLGGYARRAEMGYWVHPEARGRGVAASAVRLVTAYAESSGLVDSLMIRCAAGNDASRRVAERSGYGEVGVLRAAEPLGDGSLADLVIYARP